ncbi:hypothetical protein EOD39_12637 [Acipenser ruthenus]|uniref:Uncharacterized protein n=1 Tax=Acipenser ruthenus TaxID=7906 RepID=A0A662YQB1_ACIRT|nr:hypothetical protein EOD39_12637 [Acipenser ruthenus]
MEGARSEAQRLTRFVGQGSKGHVAVVDFNNRLETSIMERGEKEERVGGAIGGEKVVKYYTGFVAGGRRINGINFVLKERGEIMAAGSSIFLGSGNRKSGSDTAANNKSPSDGEQASPTDGEQASPGDGEQASPGDGELASPGDGELASPGDGELASPGDAGCAAPGSAGFAAPGGAGQSRSGPSGVSSIM